VILDETNFIGYIKRMIKYTANIASTTLTVTVIKFTAVTGYIRQQYAPTLLQCINITSVL